MSMDFTKNKIPSEINVTPPYQLMVIHSSKLIYPRELYQRGVQHERVAKIADDFNEYIANEPKVSYRDGKFYMFDGQHTTEGRIERNGGEFSEERLLRALHSIHPIDIYRIGRDNPEKLPGWKKYVYPIYTAYNGKCRTDALPMKF